MAINLVTKFLPYYHARQGSNRRRRDRLPTISAGGQMSAGGASAVCAAAGYPSGGL